MSGTTPPIVVTSQGAQPTPPATLHDQVISGAQVLSPGLTANLPGTLIEDVASTDTSALALIDNARVESLNSLTPYGANVFTLAQLGTMLGIQIDGATNTSVNVVFTATTPGPVAARGYVIPQGFVVSDGSYQYVVQSGGVTDSSGNTLPLLAVASQAGTWAVAPGTVTQLITSPQSIANIALTVTNPLGGTPGQAAETEWDYRSRVLTANLATAQGTSRLLKTLVANVPGVSGRFVSLRQTLAGWEAIVGGGDPYLVAYAIWQAMGPGYITLIGSTMSVTNITNAALGVVTIDLTTAGLLAGAAVVIDGAVGMTEVNGVPTTINTVIDTHHFLIDTDTSGFGTYVSGGVVTPNPRNATVPIQDYPDVYSVLYVVPPSQTVAIAVTWNTNLTNFTNGGAVNQQAAPALVDYVNAIPVGAPILTSLLEQTFIAAVSNVLPSQNIIRMTFSVSIDGIGVLPTTGTVEIVGDPESFFTAAPNSVTVGQG